MLKKVGSKAKKRILPKPKITYNQYKQVLFTFRQVLKLVFRVKPKLLTTVLILNSLLGVSGVVVFYLEKLIIDRLIAGIGTPDVMTVAKPILLFVAAGLVLSLLRMIASSITGYLRFNLSRYFELEVGLLIGEKLSRLDIATIEDPDFQDRFNKVESESGRRAWQLMMPVSNIPGALSGFVASVGVTYLIHPMVALVIVILAIPRLLINKKYIRRRYQQDRDLSVIERKQHWYNHYLVGARNFLEVKILEIADYLLKNYREVGTYYVDQKVNLGRDQMKASTWTYLPSTFFELVVSTILVVWVITEKITVGSFQLYVRSLRSAEDNLDSFVQSLIEIYEHYVYVTDFVWLMSLTSVIDDQQDGLGIPEDGLDLKVNDVWFRYRSDSSWVLKGINFEAKAGEKIALVGENGAGKSTLIKLLARFYDPDKGEIVVSGENLNKFNPRNWRKNLSVLFQQFEGYPFSAKETIGFGDIKNINDLQEIKSVAEKVGIDEYIRSLPLKYNNPLNPRFEKGVSPSVGQWQRIGIARMMFRKDARFLILDEPTSNVDPEAEEEIFGKLTEISKNKILIFVTQRFSTVKIADRILVMHQGKITEMGTHRELMARKGRYARLFNLQAKAYQMM